MNSTEYLIKISESDKTDFMKKDFLEQSEPQKVFTTVFGSSGSIMMDGLLGYFSSYHRETAHFVVEAYRKIGSPKRAEMLERACAILSKSPLPKTEEGMTKLVEAITKKQEAAIEEVQTEFFELVEPLDPLLLEYVRKHPKEFGAVPKTVKD